ncbi:MAG: ElyC/SanA/YdcF family protein [Mariprofundaceae bacterium]|nr:ElyC/SanA/YdcF family protein [Mariprofundaceae bacterium]
MKLFSRKERVRPTLAGWLVLFLFVLSAGAASVYTIYDFLASSEPVDSDILVVEGWMSDDELVAGVAVAEKNHVSLLITSGGPLVHGSYLSRYHTYAELAAATLHRLGVTIPVRSVSTPPAHRDRTYASALALKRWLQQNRPDIRSFNLLTVGPHARRSHFLFEQAFGSDYNIGVIALADPSYNGQGWWHSSAGVRAVIGETIAWVYAAFVFSPPDKRSQ